MGMSLIQDNVGVIITGGIGIVATIVSWQLGGRQTSLTDGVDKITKTSNNLLTKMDEMLDQERKRFEQEREHVKIEREHREMCEVALKEHKELLDDLRKEIEEIKKNEI